MPRALGRTDNNISDESDYSRVPLVAKHTYSRTALIIIMIIIVAIIIMKIIICHDSGGLSVKR